MKALALALRFSSLALALIVIGSVGLSGILRRAPGIRPERAMLLQRQAAATGAAFSLTLLLASVPRLYLQLDAMRFPGEPITQSLKPLFETPWGASWSVQVLSAVVALMVFLRAMSSGALRLTAAMLILPALAASFSLASHAMTIECCRSAMVAADSAHILAAGLWIGTLVVVGLLMINGRLTVDELAAIVREFSPLALSAAGVVAITGTIAAIAHVGTIDALFSTRYGRTLLIKLFAVALILFFGYRNWKHNTPRALEDRGVSLRRGIMRELISASLAVGATAALVATELP
jgi:putative copper export protein